MQGVCKRDITSEWQRESRSEQACPLLEVVDVSVAWGDEPVVDAVSFELFPNECICLVGRSGSGKTSLFNVLAGLQRPASGAVMLRGQDITGVSGHVGYMLQKDLLLEQRVILDNVALPMLVAGVSKREARRRADAMFVDFGIEGTQRMYPCQLSGGMRQRAALLRTYFNSKDVILMDEPFSALDALTRADMQKWLLGVTASFSFASVMITHDVDEALLLADEIMVLGSIGDTSLPSRILSRIRIPCSKDRRAEFLFSDEALTIKREVLGLLGA